MRRPRITTWLTTAAALAGSPAPLGAAARVAQEGAGGAIFSLNIGLLLWTWVTPQRSRGATSVQASP